MFPFGFFRRQRKPPCGSPTQSFIIHVCLSMKQAVMCTAEKFRVFFSAPCHGASLTPPTEPGIASLFLQVWHLLSLLSPFFQLLVNCLFHFPALCSSPLWVSTSSVDSSSLGPLQQVILSHDLLPFFFFALSSYYV